MIAAPFVRFATALSALVAQTAPEVSGIHVTNDPETLEPERAVFTVRAPGLAVAIEVRPLAAPKD